MVVFFAEGVGRSKSAERRVGLAGVEVIEIQAVHAVQLLARILIEIGRRKDIAEIATCRVRHIGISREANERRDNQRYDMSKVHIHLTKLMLYLKYDCFVLLANVLTPSELTKFYRQIQPKRKAQQHIYHSRILSKTLRYYLDSSNLPLGSLLVQVKCRVFERERTVYVGFSRYTVGYKPSETHLKPSLKRI